MAIWKRCRWESGYLYDHRSVTLFYRTELSTWRLFKCASAVQSEPRIPSYQSYERRRLNGRFVLPRCRICFCYCNTKLYCFFSESNSSSLPPPLPRFDSRGIFLSIRLFWSLLHWATPMLSPCRLPSSFHFGSASVSVAPTAKAMARHHHHHNSVWLIMLGYWYTPGTDEWAAGISGEISGGFVRQETLIACLMAEGIKRSTPPICLLPVTAASYQLDAITTFPRKTLPNWLFVLFTPLTHVCISNEEIVDLTSAVTELFIDG